MFVGFNIVFTTGKQKLSLDLIKIIVNFQDSACAMKDRSFWPSPRMKYYPQALQNYKNLLIGSSENLGKRFF